MKSVPKLIRRFVGVLLLSSFLILFANFVIYAIIVTSQSPDKDHSPYKIATETGKDLKRSSGSYTLSEKMSRKLQENGAWALLIDNETSQVVWHTSNLPNSIPMSYTLHDIADLTQGYIDGYPTYTGQNKNGLVVLGFPKKSFWKHTSPSWNYNFITNLPQTLLITLLVNLALIFLTYILANMKLLKSVKPITQAIQMLSTGQPTNIPEKGVLSEIAANINSTSNILQEQKKQLRKKETARANWIAGISHDIRTPLSMVMGYADQLENSRNLSDTEQRKAAVIVKQSERIKNLVDDLNLASKLEYNMQPLIKKQINAVAVVRQVVVDFINTDFDHRFPIEWTTNEAMTTCSIFADNNLLKRAVSNLIQNCINHNNNGCKIFVSVDEKKNACIICIQDNGIGASDQQIEKLNTTPHYMVCDSNTTEQRHGLGLLIVRQIIAGHDGKVEIGQSEYGGFKVIMTIPK